MSLQAHILGSSGSIPAPLPTSMLREKLRCVLRAASGRIFDDEASVERFLGELPESCVNTFKGNTSCVEIIQPDARVFCDAGSGLKDFRPVAGEAPVYHFFISHLHWDHIQGFPFFQPAFSEGARIVFHTMHAGLESVLRMQMNAPCFPVAFESLKARLEFEFFEPGATLTIGGLTVRTIRHEHSGGSSGFRFERDGKSIVYSSDCEHGTDYERPDYPFVEFYRDADILIFDAQFTREETLSNKRHWGHSCENVGLDLARRAGVRHLVLFHHDVEVSDTELYARLKALRETHVRSGEGFPLRISLAYDGLLLDD